VAISPNGKLIASGCSANAIRIWDAADMRHSIKSIPYHQSIIRTLSFCPDELTLASGSEDNTVKFWNRKTWHEVGSIRFADHVRLVVFSPDGNNLAVITDMGRLHLLRALPLAVADQYFAAWAK
jgi:WD40 repeat protein